MTLIAAPVINTGLDLSKMSTVVAKMATSIIRKYFKTLDCTRHFATDYDVTKAKKYPKLVVKGKLRKYDGTIKTNAGDVILSDRQLVVTVGQKELGLEPESFRDTWAAEMANISEGRVPLEVYILEDYSKNSLLDIDADIFYKGDTANVAFAGLPGEIADGLEKKLLAETTGGSPAIVPVSVPVFNEGTGSGLNAVAGNYNTVCFTVWNAQLQAIKKMPTDMFISYDHYAGFGRSYRREFGHEATYSKDALDQEFIYLDGTQKKCRLIPASWLGNSSRLIVAPYGAIRIGTDIKQMATSIKIMDMGYVYAYLCKIVFGVQIIDLEAVTISSRA